MQLNINSELQGGKYRILRVLGQGGFGITYLAENVFFDRLVAIKEFFPKDFCGRDNTSHLTLGTQNNAETVEKLKARFLKEAKNIAKLDHDGIVRIHDIFEENNTAYYVMDYIDGESLSEMVKRVGPLSESKAIEYIRKVGDALDYIHSRNMTHFDVKPANIMIRRKDDKPILIDFGLSKQYDIKGDATSTLMQAVSQGYSPLELYSAGSVSSFSPQTDVYSLGATLYYLITGNTPPIASDIIDNGLQLPSFVSSDVNKAISCAMTISRAKRPSCVSTFLDKLNTNPPSNNFQNRPAPAPASDDTILIDAQKNSQKNKPIGSYSAPKSTKNESTSLKTSGCFWACVTVCIVIVMLGIISNSEPTNTDNNSMNGQQVEETVVLEVVPDSAVAPNAAIVDNSIQYHTKLGYYAYSGEVDDLNKPHGKGTAKFNSGVAKTYDGEWEHGKMYGHSKYTLRNGDVFEGQFINDEYYFGTYRVYETGECYYGYFDQGQPSRGQWYDKNGQKIN